MTLLGYLKQKRKPKNMKKKYGIRTEWFSRNKIQEYADGWSINNSKVGTFTFAATADNVTDLGVNVGEVVTDALEQSPAKSSGSSSIKEGFSLWVKQSIWKFMRLEKWQ